MAKLHAKCPRCGAAGWRHGGRRRYCPQCGRTWSIRPRRRGPRPRRSDWSLPVRLLAGKTTTDQLAASHRCSVATLRRRCRQACRVVADTDSLPRLPTDSRVPLALVVDGMWCRFGHQYWVLYNMAVKPAGTPMAFFLESVLILGRESGPNWERALTTIPPAIGQRIRVIVADGFSGHKHAARTRGWLVQRCHRHLDVTLWGIHSRRKYRRLRGGAVRRAIHEDVLDILSTPDRQRVADLQQRLRRQAEYPGLSVQIAGVVRRLLHDLASFRTYLDYPELDLPTTTNVVESRNSRLRKVVSCVNNPAAALLRVRAYTRLHPSITCNGHTNPQK